MPISSFRPHIAYTLRYNEFLCAVSKPEVCHSFSENGDRTKPGVSFRYDGNLRRVNSSTHAFNLLPSN